jgi:hypothetical protein
MKNSWDLHRINSTTVLRNLLKIQTIDASHEKEPDSRSDAKMAMAIPNIG